MRKLLIFCTVVFSALSACTNKNVYTDFYSLKNAEWDKDSICRFEFEITDTLNPLNVFVEIRNNNNYQYSNLWLFIDIKTPSGAIRRDTMNCKLADDMGKWYGQGISIYEFEAPYEKSVIYTQSGIYTLSIRHGMRNNILEGITEIGFKLQKSD